MSLLDRRDLQQVLRLGLEAAGARDRREFASVALAGLDELVPNDVGTYNEIDSARGEAQVFVHPETLELDTPTFNRWLHQHPLIGHYRDTGDGRALKISDFLDADGFHALDLYAEFFGPLGIEHQMVMTLPSRQPHVIGIALNRCNRDFDERERERLNALRPHLALAHRRIVEREELETRVEALERGIDALGEGIVLLAPDGRIQHASARARELVGQVLGTELRDRLPERLDGLYVRRVGGEAETGVIVLSRTPPPEAHGLTPRELEVLASIADGLTAAQVGTALGISVRTVEQHLANVYEKLRVHTAAGAVARVFGR